MQAAQAEQAVPAVNLLIDRLPRKDRNRILQHCGTVDLAFGDVLCEAQSPLRHAFFPLTGFISVVAAVAGHLPLEMGLIGNEGMLGATQALGVEAAPLRAVVQGKGTALRMTGPQLRSHMRGSPALSRVLHRYLYVFIGQLANTAACTHFHEVSARLARWLLMTCDRAHSDKFHLTHEELAGMLGVRRSGVTVAAVDLKRRHLIRYARGEITILDRKGLEAVCCECYAAALGDYTRMFG